jgi:hypothetical protein
MPVMAFGGHTVPPAAPAQSPPLRRTSKRRQPIDPANDPELQNMVEID